MPRTKIYLIGPMNNQILGSKLPSNNDCLSVLFYNMRVVKLTLSEAANLVIDECLILWKKARIPTKHRVDCVKNLKKLYESWRKLDKSAKRASETQKQAVKKFVENLNNLFDIAHAEALNQMTLEEDKQFLLAQRRPHREGCMLGIDLKTTAAEKRKAEKLESEEVKKRKAEAEIEKLKLIPIPNFSSSEDTEENTESNNMSARPGSSGINVTNLPGPSPSGLGSSSSADEYPVNIPSSSGIRRARKPIMTARLSAALDKSKVSDRGAVHILSACVEFVVKSDGLCHKSNVCKNSATAVS